MIIMGVDFGDVRTGLAVCDKFEMMATGAGCVKGGFRGTLEAVAKKAQELSAELIVVGNPVNMSGEEGERSAKCRDFASELEKKTGIRCVMYDERLTSVSAHRYLHGSGLDGRRHKNYVDELSAKLILEDYLTSRKNGSVEML